MMQQEPGQPREEERDELDSAELAAENAAELPDREAMSVVSPSPGMGLRPMPPDIWYIPPDTIDPTPA